MTRPLVFVVGTGRCGSTLLSDLVRRHPEVLSLSEFFVTLSPTAFPVGPVGGAAFWSILAEPRLKPNTLLKHGVRVPEFIYPVGSGRFDPVAGIPAISLVTLPHLTGDPDVLYDELAAVVPGWPVRDVTDHYRALFDLLAARFGRSFVVERSGGSLRFVGELARRFPDAKFVHLYRDGRDCAVSMSRHAPFRLAVAISEMRPHLGVDPFHEPSAGHGAALPAELRAFLPATFDPAALARRDLPVETFAAVWSRQVVEGVVALRAVPRGRLLTLSYESLTADPEGTLTAFAEFAGIAPEAGWLAAARGAVGSGASQWRDLPAAERDAVERSCRPGMRVLGLDGAR